MTNSIGLSCNIKTGKLDANAAVKDGSYPFFTCAEYPDSIDHFAFDDDVVLVAGNNANGNFHVTRFSGKFNAYQRTYILTAKDGVDIDYVFYALKLELKRLKEKSQGSQTKFLTMPILNGIQLQNLNFNEQSAISGVLKVIDKKIDCNNRLNVELEAMSKLIYDYWFLQFEFPNSVGKPYKSSGGPMVYNAELKREIPENWRNGSLWDIAHFFNGLAMQKYRATDDEFLPVIKIKEMNDGISDSTEKASISIPKEAIIDDGDVLFSWSATLDVKIWSQGKGALNQHIFKVTSKKFPKSFYYFELLAYLSHFKMMAEKRKTTMGHITQDHLKQSRICIPPFDLLLAADEMITPILQKRLSCEKENQMLSKLRDWLLPMLMNGQVTVE